MKARRKAAPRAKRTGSPFLHRIESLPEKWDPAQYPFNIRAFSTGIDLRLRAYGGKSLHEQSHGESFISLFAHRFEQGIYILDEPEAALSPQRQLSFLKIIHDLSTPGHAQFLIATHSPILLSFPGAVLFDLDGDTIQEIDYRETKHFLITRDFLNSPERFFKHLLAAPDHSRNDE